MKKILVLDIGPGEKAYTPTHRERVITIDFNKKFNPTKVHDLTKFPWPFKDNTFDKIYASHIIEHIPSTVRAMEEIYRIAKPNALVIIRVPHFSSRSAWINPTHYKAFSIGSFDYFDQNMRQPYGNCNFRVMKKELRYTRADVPHDIVTRVFTKFVNFIANLNQNFCDRVWCYWVGGFSEVYFELKVIK
ncbi:MAG: class I SAM-dependent methyltransferase [Candidatus Aenigmarchaeota archaeon]|nr:class I SAM-dependent methyltransferase [Candidatus Aenigmarchaeota archaeon]